MKCASEVVARVLCLREGLGQGAYGQLVLGVCRGLAPSRRYSRSVEPRQQRLLEEVFRALHRQDLLFSRAAGGRRPRKLLMLARALDELTLLSLSDRFVQLC